MSKFFLDILNLSITASWLIVAVLATRFIFRKRAPKWVNCLLWSLVGLRLLLPFTIESPFSLSVNREVINTDAVYGEAPADTVPPVDDTIVPPSVNEGGQTQQKPETENDNQNPDVVPEPAPETDKDKEYIQSGLDVLDDRINPVINGAVSSVSKTEKDPIHKLVNVFSYIWLAGVGVMLTYAVIVYFLLKRRVSASVPCENSVRKSERVDTPFILGVFRPRIYLPFGLSEQTEQSVVAHEIAHLKRKDHLIKPLGYAILSVYWFNPLVWVAYSLLCRDIESACDEKVIKNMDTEARKAYATALLECSLRKNFIAACPLAFGETGVKNRVKNTMNYRKPAFWVIISALLVCVIVSVLFLTSPGKAENDISETISEDSRQTESSDTSVTDVSDDVTSSDVSEYIGEVSVSDEVSSESSDTDISEEISDEVSQEPAEESTPLDDNDDSSNASSNDNNDDTTDDEWYTESGLLRATMIYIKSHPELSGLASGKSYQVEHQTPEEFDANEHTGRGFAICTLVVNVYDYYTYLNTDSYDESVIKEAGLKVWICQNGEKIDYVYTNSKGQARFFVLDGMYSFYLEENETYDDTRTTNGAWCKEGEHITSDYNLKLFTYDKTVFKDLEIYVTDAETGEPIEGVRFYSPDHEDLDGLTDINGKGKCDSLLSYVGRGMSQERTLYFRKDGYDWHNDYIKITETYLHIELKKTQYYEFKFIFVDYYTGEPIEGVYTNANTGYAMTVNNRVAGEDGVISGIYTSEYLKSYKSMSFYYEKDYQGTIGLESRACSARLKDSSFECVIKIKFEEIYHEFVKE